MFPEYFDSTLVSCLVTVTQTALITFLTFSLSSEGSTPEFPLFRSLQAR
jgi:hypothetical protein